MFMNNLSKYNNLNISENSNKYAIIANNVYKQYEISKIRNIFDLFRKKNKLNKNEKFALKNISFKIKKGEKVGIVGINGSGKSTLLQIIANVLQPSAGTVVTNGKVCALLELGSGFNPNFTGLENIKLNAAILGLNKEETGEILDDIIQFADIGESISKTVSTYSTGMKMRLAFAIQAFVEPNILIVDEALSVGDQFFKMKCFNRINELLESGITFLLVSHNEETIRTFTDRAIFLHNGEIITDGEVNDSINKYNLLLTQNRRKVFSSVFENINKTPALPFKNNPLCKSSTRIKNVQILDQYNKECNHFENGDMIRVLMSFSLKQAHESLSFGVRLRNKEGLKIYSWYSTEILPNSKLSKINNSKIDNQYVGRIQFDFTCNLGSNFYRIEAYIFDKKDCFLPTQEILDWISDAAFFTVTVNKTRNFFGGICDLQMSAKLINKHDEKNRRNPSSRSYHENLSPASRFTRQDKNDLRASLLDIMKLKPISKILDLSCGITQICNELRALGFEAIGIDVSEKVIKYCQGNRDGDNQVKTAFNLPFKDNEFDTLISIDLMEHISEVDLSLVIQEIYRVTSRQVYLRLGGFKNHKDKGMQTIKSRKWWETFFMKHGFRLHPLTQQINSFESLENELKEITICLEKIPEKALFEYSFGWLSARRCLHADMLRESNRRSDAHIARYSLARQICPKQGHVLDVACGLGYGSHILSFGRPQLNITGVDSDRDAIDYSTNNYVTDGNRLTFKVCKIEDLTNHFAFESMDMICSFETIEHIQDIDSFMKSIHDLLRPKGIFICSVPNMWVDETGKDPNPHHLHVFDYNKLFKLVSKVLKPVEMYAQIAGNGNKFPDRPRTLKNIKIGSEFRNVEAEWCLLKAQKCS